MTETPAADKPTPNQPETPVTAEVEIEVSALSPEVVSEIGAALKEVLGPVLALVSRFEALENQVKELAQTDEEKVATKAAQTPQASLSSLLVRSIIGDPGTRVNGNTQLAKQKPVENKEVEHSGGILSGVIGSILADHTHTQN